MVRISFCAVSTSLTRTGPLASRSSRNSSAARLDMFLKIFSLTPSSEPLRASTSTSEDTSPQIRGRHRSRTVESVVAEARQLVKEGVKEINLISQDTTYFGMDTWEQRPNPRTPVDSSRGTALTTLLRQLNAIEGDFWIRLLYTHPAHWSDELIKTIAECPKVARYIDIPLQHISDAVAQSGVPFLDLAANQIEFARRLQEATALSFEAIGLKVSAEQAFLMLKPGGTATVIGMIPVGEKIELPGHHFLQEKKIQGSMMGSNRFPVDMPRLNIL